MVPVMMRVIVYARITSSGVALFVLREMVSATITTIPRPITTSANCPSALERKRAAGAGALVGMPPGGGLAVCISITGQCSPVVGHFPWVSVLDHGMLPLRNDQGGVDRIPDSRSDLPHEPPKSRLGAPRVHGELLKLGIGETGTRR